MRYCGRGAAYSTPLFPFSALTGPLTRSESHNPRWISLGPIL